uniref:Uncharacterized protein n=1 Tax=Knipowitschia caucasica TaxID=637954 RepID=A0AAV2JVV1_KNICA
MRPTDARVTADPVSTAHSTAGGLETECEQPSYTKEYQECGRGMGGAGGEGLMKRRGRSEVTRDERERDELWYREVCGERIADASGGGSERWRGRGGGGGGGVDDKYGVQMWGSVRGGVWWEEVRGCGGRGRLGARKMEGGWFCLSCGVCNV